MSNQSPSPYDEYESPFPRNRLPEYLRLNLRWVFIVYYKVLFLSGRRIYRWIRQSERHRLIRRDISYTEPERNLWRIVWRLFIDESQKAILLFFMVVSVLLALYFTDLSNSTNAIDSIIELFLAFITLFGLLSSFYIILNLFWLRSRYIVTPFYVQDAKLEGMSELLKYHFITEIKRISRLLNLRQVENVGVDSNLALFTTSGQHQDLIDDLQALAILNNNGTGKSSAIGSFLSGLITTILRLLAVARISGHVEKHLMSGIHVRIDFAKRNRDTISVDVLEVGLSEQDLLDEMTVQNLARQLALKLIYQLGHGTHLASSVESLQHFLVGLQASTERNWWRAADAYQSNIAIEEDKRGQFGMGHYHLGVALISQGNIDEGVRHLERAQMSGPPLAETYYVLALIKLSDNFAQLHRRRIELEMIQKWCDVALSIRPDFPEVYHLLGETYYQRAKLIQRSQTRTIKNPEKPPELSFKADYVRAEYCFRRARDLYRRAIRRIRSRYRINQDIQADLARIIKERLMVTHRLGDVLRSLELYQPAQSYYRDVLAALPNNVRTLVDLGKTYCLDENWYGANKFLLHRARRVSEAQWDSDLNFYIGWMFAGGVSAYSYQSLKENYILLGRAISHLDYALYLRPQYFDSWDQTAWRNTFEKVIKKCEADVGTIHENTIIVKSKLDNGAHDEKENVLAYRNYYHQLKLWLEWREYGLSHKDKSEIDSNYPNIATILGLLVDGQLEKSLSHQFEEMRKLRKQFVILSEMIQQSGRFRGMHHATLRITIATKLEDVWKLANEAFETLQKTWAEKDITLLERIAVDMLAQIALLGAKAMVEARLYEKALPLLDDTLTLLEDWTKRWDSHYSNKGHFFLFSPRVTRFQLATLYGWRAYCLVIGKDDEEVFRYIDDKTDKKVFHDIDDKTDKELAKPKDRNAIYCIQRALRYMPHHPLVLYVQAWLFKSNNQYERAIEELSRLESILQPFDHNNKIANWRILNKTPEYDTRSHDPDYEFVRVNEQKNREKKLRFQLSRQEMIGGQEQFSFIINPTTVHVQIAENYTALGRNELAVSHLMRAVILSEYNDIDADALLEIIQQLDDLNRFGDAKAVIKTLRSQRFLLEDMTLSAVKQYIPGVLECVLLTRTEHYSESLQKGKVLYDRLSELAQIWLTNGKEGRDKLAKLYLERFESPKLVKIFVPTDPTDDKPNRDLAWDNGYPNVVKTIIGNICNIIVPSEAQAPNTTLNVCHKAWFNGDEFTSHLTKLEKKYKDDKEKNQTLRLVMLYFFCWDAVRLAELMSLLRNNLAYNALELQIQNTDFIHDKIKEHELQSNTLINQSVETLEDLYDLAVKEGNHKHIKRISRLLAFSLDTQAWLYLRLSTIDNSDLHEKLLNDNNLYSALSSSDIPDTATEDAQDALTEGGTHTNTKKDSSTSSLANLNNDASFKLLNEAQEKLTRAISLHQSAAIFYYHLARVQITLLERYWYAKEENDFGKILPIINGLLIRVYQNWERAHQLDTHKRLSPHLTRLGIRIEEYRTAWHNRKRSSLER